MDNSVKIYKDQYQHLPSRFVVKLEQDLQYLLEKNIPGLTKVYLFGSCARGEVRSTSDLDLAVVTKKKLEDRVLAADIRWTLDEPVEGVRTDVVYMNEETPREPSVFQNLFERDKKLILEVKP